MSEETEEPAQEKYDETQERDIFSGGKKRYIFLLPGDKILAAGLSMTLEVDIKGP